MGEITHKQSQVYLSSLFSSTNVKKSRDQNISSSGSFSNGSSTYTNTADGFTNPGWKYDIAHSINATTPFSGVAVKCEPSVFISVGNETVAKSTLDPAGTIFQNDDTSGTIHCPPPSDSSPSGSLVASVRNRCIRSFLQQASSIQSSFEAGQDLGELRQTLDSMIHPLNSLKHGMISYLTQVKKLKSKHARFPHRLMKIVSDTYLEFHFGWQPLAADVASLIADIGRFRYPITPVTATATATYQGDSSNRNFGGGFLRSTIQQNYLTTYKFTVRMKGAVKSNAAMNTGQLSWAQSLQLTPERWLPTAWDLLPNSWIADYFVNIGDILQGAAFLNSSLAWGCKTELTRMETLYDNVTLSDVGTPPPTYYWETKKQYAYGGRTTSSRRKVERSAFSGSDLLPTLEFRIPTSKYPFFNIGALLAQKSRSIVPLFDIKHLRKVETD